MEQKIITSDNDYDGLDGWLVKAEAKKVFLVCDSSLKFLENISEKIGRIKEQGTTVISFSDFQPNPGYESVVKGVDLFRKEKCDVIMAIGGGSALDVAKCIKLYSNMDGNGAEGDYLKQSIVPNDIPFLAMPTTAGTGSEATRYAVIYYEGKKQSITSDSIIPGTVLLDPDALKTLPLYQKKATMSDALCHAIESFWSVNSTEESIGYSKEAIRMILENMDGYLDNTEDGRKNMLLAANLAGKAINITQTTAGHAMCYKITSLFGCAHGHAAVLCDRVLFPWMIQNISKTVDVRGKEYLKGVLDDIAKTFGCSSTETASTFIEELFDRLELEVPVATDEQINELVESVNPVRLKNHPIGMDKEDIELLYRRILKTE